MTMEISPRNRKMVLVLIIVISIAAGILATVAFEEWLRGDSSYLLHGAVAALFVGVIFLHARNLFRFIP